MVGTQKRLGSRIIASLENKRGMSREQARGMGMAQALALSLINLYPWVIIKRAIGDANALSASDVADLYLDTRNKGAAETQVAVRAVAYATKWVRDEGLTDLEVNRFLAPKIVTRWTQGEEASLMAIAGEFGHESFRLALAHNNRFHDGEYVRTSSAVRARVRQIKQRRVEDGAVAEKLISTED